MSVDGSMEHSLQEEQVTDSKVGQIYPCYLSFKVKCAAVEKK